MIKLAELHDGKEKGIKLSVLKFVQSVKFDLICLLLLSSFTCRALFTLNQDIIAGTDILGMPYRPMWPYLWSRFGNWLYTWTPFSGCGSTINLPVPIFFIGSVLSIIVTLVSVPATFISKMLMFILFPLASFSMYLLARRLIKSRSGSFIAALFYMYNQFFLSEHISEGHYLIPFGYAIAPLALLMLEKVLQCPNMKNILFLSVVLTFFWGSTSQSAYLLSLFAAAYTIIRGSMLNLSQRIKIKAMAGILLSIVLCFLLSAYWLLPETFVVNSSNVLFSTYHTIDDANKYSFNSLIDALSIRSSADNVYGQRIPYWEAPILQETTINILIPVLAFAVIIFQRDLLTIFITIAALFSSLFALGPNGLQNDAFIWLWTHVPGYSTFRVGGRFLMVTALSYSYLIGTTVSFICRRIRSTVSSNLNGQANPPISKRILTRLPLDKFFLASIITLIVLYSWVGSIDGFQAYSWPEDYMEPFEWIRDQPGDFRVVTTPYQRLYAKYPWSSATLDLGIFSYGIHYKGLFSGGSGYMGDYTAFIGNLIRSNSTNSLGSLFGIAGVRFIVTEPDTFPHEKPFLEKQYNMVPINLSNSTLLENLKYSPHLFATQKSTLVFGGRDTITSLTCVDEFELDQWTIQFYDQISPPNEVYDNIVLSGMTLNDLAFMTGAKNYTLNLANYAFPSSNRSKNWISYTELLEQGFLVLGRSTLSTKGSVSVDVPIEIQEEGSYEVWLRIAHGPDRGKLTVSLNGQTIGSDIYPYCPFPFGFSWVKLQKVYLKAGDHVITVTNDGSGYADLDIMAVIQPEELNSILNKALNDLQYSGSRVIYILEAEHAFAKNLNGWQPSRSWGCNASNGATLLSNIPTMSSTQILIPKDGDYRMAVRMVKGKDYGNLVLQIDDGRKFKLECDSSTTGFTWFEAGNVKLLRGEHTLKILNDGAGKVDLDELIIYSINEVDGNTSLREVFSTPNTPQPIYRQINPTEYEVQIRTETPFWLIFSESYNPLWRAYINNEEIEPVITYSFMNGFYVDQTGDLVIKVYFTGQTYFYIGGLISTITLTCILAYPCLKRCSKYSKKIKGIIR